MQYFNGHLLFRPTFAYDFLVIIMSGNQIYYLTSSVEFFHSNGILKARDSTGTTVRIVRYSYDAMNGLSLPSTNPTNVNEYTLGSSKILYSNHDIVNWDTKQVYYSASPPVEDLILKKYGEYILPYAGATTPYHNMILRDDSTGQFELLRVGYYNITQYYTTSVIGGTTYESYNKYVGVYTWSSNENEGWVRPSSMVASYGISSKTIISIDRDIKNTSGTVAYLASDYPQPQDISTVQDICPTYEMKNGILVKRNAWRVLNNEVTKISNI